MLFSNVLAAKFGVEPSGCVELAKHVCLNCPNLEFCGLMTIGMLDYTSTPENFKVFLYLRTQHTIFCLTAEDFLRFEAKFLSIRH